MKVIPTVAGMVLLGVLVGGAWVLRYRPQWLEPSVQEAAEDEDIDPQKLAIPVHVAKVTRATLHLYVDAFGTVEPAPARQGRMAGTADIAAPVAGVVAEILCEAGQLVKKGDALIQLDERLAVAAEQQAAAALAEAQASQAKLKSTPRPEQLQAGQLAVEKAAAAVDFAQKNYERQQELVKAQGTSAHTAEQAALELNSARNELSNAQIQLTLLKPTPEELAQEDAKVAAAQAALSSAQTQRQLLKISSPIDGTVIAINANPGESVDTAKVLVDVVGLDRLVVNVAVPASESTSLNKQLPAQIYLVSAGTEAQSLEGTVYFIGSEVDRKTSTIPIGIDVSPGAQIKPGQSVRVRIIAQEHKDCLAVPKESVVSDENGDQFIATVEGDQATHKIVKVGLREGDLIEIEGDGLKAGDAIVSNGAYTLAKFQVAKVKVLEK